MRLREWPTKAKVRTWTLAIAAHSRGDTGAGGHYSFERGPGAQWRGQLEIPPMCSADAVEFRAFLHSLRGRSGSFYLPTPSRNVAGADPCTNRTTGRTQFSDCTRFTDGKQFDDTWTGGVISGTLTAAVAADAASFAVSSATGLQVGDFLLLNNQLHRIVGISGTTVSVRPRVRTAVANGAAWQVGPVTALFRLMTEAPIVPLVPGRSTAVQIDVEEYY
jgi:hypothetical protein